MCIHDTMVASINEVVIERYVITCIQIFIKKKFSLLASLTDLDSIKWSISYSLFICFSSKIFLGVLVQIFVKYKWPLILKSLNVSKKSHI